MKILNKQQKRRLIDSFNNKSHAEFIRDFQIELSKRGFYDNYFIKELNR